MFGTAAELDYMLKDAGSPVTFSRGASTLATTHGILDSKQLVVPGVGGLEDAGHDITLVIRDDTQGTTTIEDVATVTIVDSAGVTLSTTAYHVRDLGIAQADGTRRLMLAGG